jgi:hypothetical protein
MTEKDPYGRYNVPKLPTTPSPLSFKRPFAQLFLLALKACWRLSGLEQCKWSGERNENNYYPSIKVDHGVSVWFSWIPFAAIPAGLTVFSPYFICFPPLFFLFVHFVRHLFGLHTQEGRNYWTEKLDF